jgi:hypothetical protein
LIGFHPPDGSKLLERSNQHGVQMMMTSPLSNKSSYALLLSAAAFVLPGGTAFATELSSGPHELARQLLSRETLSNTKLRSRATVSEPVSDAQERARELLLSTAARSPAPAHRANGTAVAPRVAPSDPSQNAQSMAHLMIVGTKG